MTLRTFEDIAVGETHEAGPLLVTREAIIAFAETYDAQPFHLDEVAGAASLLGGLSASGWHTTALGMRLLFEGFVGRIACMGAPGVDDLRWHKPVRPGDSLSMVLTVDSARPSASRPDRGFLGVHLELRNGRGDPMMSQRFTILVLRRGATQVAGAPLRAPADVVPVTRPDADLMLTAFMDEVEVGHEADLGTQLFTPDLITGFASLYDPQPFHLDAAAARQTHFGDLCASGWQTAAFWMKHFVATRKRSAAARDAAGLPVAPGGPSPGVNDLKWLRPVHVGRTLRYGMKITGKRRTSRKGWGMVGVLGTGQTSDGVLAFSFQGHLLWPLAPGQPPTPP